MLKILMPILLILSLSATTAVFGYDLTDGLVAHYPFNANAQDHSGYENHGAPNSTTQLTSDRFDNIDSAYHFNGINSHITIPGSVSLDSANLASTQFAWIQLEGFSQVGSHFGPILMKSNSSSNAFMYRLNASPGGFGVAYGSWNNTAGTLYDVPLNTWFNIASTWDGEVVRFYVNGIFIGEDDITANLNQDGRPLVIGGDFPGAYESFLGKIDEVRVYNRALSAAEILELGGNELSPAPWQTAKGIEMSNGHPNPFGASTSVSFRLPETSSVTIEVFDLAGRRVRQLAAGEIYSREGSFSWDGKDSSGRLAPSGIYHYRLSTAKGLNATGRMVLQR